MGYWAVDIDSLKGEEFVITKSHRYASLMKGDQVVFFTKYHTEIEFQLYSEIISVSHEIEKEAENKYLTIASISGKNKINNPLTVRDLAYSLEKVYRFSRPYLHFNRQYVILSDIDWETIIDGSIFWSRTAFGIFINELQEEQLNRFIRELAQTDPGLLLPTPDYRLVWKSLNKFIQNEFISASNLLTEIHKQVDSLNRDYDLGLDYNELGFSTDDNEKPDFLFQQEQSLSNFVSSLRFEGEDILQVLTENIEKSNSEQRFQKIFGGTPWPLHGIRI